MNSQQASAIPHLIVAPKAGPQLPPDQPTTDSHDEIDRSIYTNGSGDARGYYADGAYTAAPNAPSSIPDQDPTDSEEKSSRLTTAYYASLATSFAVLRSHLHQTPPQTALSVLSKNQSPHVPRFGPNSATHTIWTARLRDHDPAPAQVASMDKGAVLRVLRVLLGGRFLRVGEELAERTSRWVWALLARLPDRGELDHAETGYVRELGKRAALLMCGLREMALLREEVELEGHGGDEEDEAVWVGEEGDEDEVEEQVTGEAVDAEYKEETPKHSTSNPAPPTTTTDDIEDGEITDSAPMDTDSEGEDLENARARLLASLDDTKGAKESQEEAYDPVRARLNTRATLNMILTVAGELYGQRDLLEFRDPFRGV